MLKIWGRTTSSNVQKVLWCCAELGIEYDRVDLGGPFGGNRDPEYLRLNPNGLVPTVNDGDLVMWESNTICRYLCTTRNGDSALSARSGRAHPCRALDGLAALGDRRRRWGRCCSGWSARRPETRDAGAIEAARRRAITAWTIVDDALDGQPYLAGDALTLAEIVARHADLSLVQLSDRAAASCRICTPGTTAACARPGFKTHIEMPIT